MRIRWTDEAAEDLIRICDYIDQHSSCATARRIALAIHQEIDGLARFPECGRTGRRLDTRELVFEGLPYLAIYRLRQDSVEIPRILHAAQIWP